MKFKLLITIIATLVIISSCKDKDDKAGNKRLHAILDSLQKTMPAYNAEKMISHYKALSAEQKSSTVKIQIDFKKLILILSNLNKKKFSNL